MRILLLALILSAALLPAWGTTRTQGAVPFDARWTLRGERTRITTSGGAPVLEVETGFADRKDIAMQDGTLEFDVQLTDRRSFVYVHFRVQNENDREEFYLRPHKSNLPDAVQYAPVWQGKSAWQLHHGPGGTAATPLPAGQWMRVRVVVQGTRAAIFVGDLERPALVVPRLSREPASGYVSLGGFLPADVPGAGPIARFRDVVVRPDDVRFTFPSAAATGAPVASEIQVIREWAVSRAFVPGPGDPPTLPPDTVTGEFERIPAEPSGLVQLHRHVKVPEGSRMWAAVARVSVRSEAEATVPMDLGFSDVATVFVNSVPIFRADASYSFDRPRREGLIGYDQATMFLPLKRGDNEVAVLVADSFGGWGLMGRLIARPEMTRFTAR
jgi:hypothetical protein